MTGTIGRSLELFYIDGRPDGMLTAELFNWTGHVLLAPRTQLAAALARPEARYTGVYLLLGEQDGKARAYVGEGEDIAARIRDHDVKKDWWTSAVLITTAANKLNKAHIKYLEARLVEVAQNIGRVPLDNGNTPSKPSLSEADTSKMEGFLDTLHVVLPAVRVDMFIQRARPAAASATSESLAVPLTAPPPTARFILETPLHALTAQASLRDGEFIVEAGSLARLKWAGLGSEHSTYAQLHAELRRGGILSEDGEHCRFMQNYAFRSPSAAAAVVNGRPTNGTIVWKEVGTGITYKEWEARQLSSFVAAP